MGRKTPEPVKQPKPKKTPDDKRLISFRIAHAVADPDARPPPRAVDRLISSPAWGGACYALLHARVFDNLLWRRRATGSLGRRWRPLPSVAASAAFARPSFV